MRMQGRQEAGPLPTPTALPPGGRQPLARAATAELTTGTALQPAAQATPVLRRSHSWGVPQVRPGCLLSSLHSPRGHIPACPSAGCPSWARPVLTDAPPEADGAGIPCVTPNKLGFPHLRCCPCQGVTGQGAVQDLAPFRETRAGSCGQGQAPRVEAGRSAQPLARQEEMHKPSVRRGGAQGDSWVSATFCPTVSSESARASAPPHRPEPLCP